LYSALSSASEIIPFICGEEEPLLFFLFEEPSVAFSGEILLVDAFSAVGFALTGTTFVALEGDVFTTYWRAVGTN